MVGVDQPQVQAALARPRRRPRRPGRAPGPGRCRRTASCTTSTPAVAQRRGEHRGVAVGAARDRAQPLGAVVDGVHRGHDGEQHLGGADVGGRLVAADVLLAGLQGEAVRRAALGVDRDADQAAGQVPLEAGRDRHEAGVRAAVEQRDAEALRGADHDVGAERARATRAGSARAGRRRPRPARRARGRASITRARVEDPAGGAGVLHQHAATARRRAARRRGRRRRPRCPSPRRGCAPPRSSAAARRRRRRTARSALRLAAAYQRHRLGRGGALVEQRGVGGGQPGQVADHGLEVEQRLEPALGDLRLVRRVGGVPGSGPRARCAGSPAG